MRQTGFTALTSMHSSRMRTARLLPVSPSMHCRMEGCLLLRGCLLLGGCLLPEGGCLLLEGECVSATRGCLLPGGCLLLGVSDMGTSATGGCLLWGVSATRGCLIPGGVWYQGGVCSGGCVSQHAMGQTPPPPPLTDRHLWIHNLRKLRLRAVTMVLFHHTTIVFN